MLFLEQSVATREVDDHREFLGRVAAEGGPALVRQGAVERPRGLHHGRGRDHVQPVAVGGVRDTLRMGYGGFLVGYTSPMLPLLDISADALLGAGTVVTSRTPTRDHKAIFVFEPSVSLDLTLAAPARLGVGASYRFVGGASVPALADSDLRGFGGIVRARLGRF